MSEAALHSSIVALVSLASGIAAKHPDMGLCQLDRLRQMGVSEAHIHTVIDIARHIRDEAGEKLDAAFDQRDKTDTTTPDSEGVCCTPTASGLACC